MDKYCVPCNVLTFWKKLLHYKGTHCTAPPSQNAPLCTNATSWPPLSPYGTSVLSGTDCMSYSDHAISMAVVLVTGGDRMNTGGAAQPNGWNLEIQ